MSQARRVRGDFLCKWSPDFITADARALDGEAAPSSAKTTDWYLASLAKAHKMKWATLDGKVNHPNAQLVS